MDHLDARALAAVGNHRDCRRRVRPPRAALPVGVARQCGGGVVKDYWGVIGLGAIVVVAMALVILGFATGIFSLTAVPN
jgi:hypothetical protein